MNKISTFADWGDCFRTWQKDIGYDAALLGAYKFETKLGDDRCQETFQRYRFRAFVPRPGPRTAPWSSPFHAEAGVGVAVCFSPAAAAAAVVGATPPFSM